MRVGTETKVLNSLSGVLRSTEEEGVCTSRSPQSKLIQSQRLPSSLFDPSSRGSRETKSSDRQLGYLQKAVIIGDSSNDNNGLALVRLRDVRSDTREGNGRSVDSRQKESAEDDLIEVRLRAA